MNSFSHLTMQLDNRKVSHPRIQSISKSEYENFRREFVFDKLKGISFGESFCEKFHITDFVLSILKNDESAKRHIENVGYIKNDIPSN